MAFRPLYYQGTNSTMPDERFFLTVSPIPVEEALRIAGVAPEASSANSHLVRRAASSEETDLGGAVIFIENEARAKSLFNRQFALCFAPRGLESLFENAKGSFAFVASPRAAFASVAMALHRPRDFSDAGPDAEIDDSAAIHPTAVIGRGARIGAGVVVGPNAVIGPGVSIGEQSSIAENASVWCAVLGEKVRIGAGTALGGPGFGFVTGQSGLQRIPQLGRAIVGDRVEIGANCCVDRGALGDTEIGAGTKIDNLVQIAHNVRIGENCIIAAQVGVAGSAKIGARVQFGGQAGIADHVTIGEDARIAAKAGVMRDIPPGETWGGYPARPMVTWLRETAATARAATRNKKKATTHDQH